MDVDDGYILWTGIWKGMLPLTSPDHFMHDSFVSRSPGKFKRFTFSKLITKHWFIVCSADIVKMIESQPDLASQIRRVRGGYLKIQGTWMPYEVFSPSSMRVARPADGIMHAGCSSPFSSVGMIGA
jgi:hypothetical protein